MAPVDFQLGWLEPHAGLLTVPPDDQLLYKVMSIDNLVRSVRGGYLHFNRVDCYGDGPGADQLDGCQLPLDEPGNIAARFLNAPDFSAADLYNRSRSRTYACCFSLENSEHIWQNYGNGSEKGKVALVFEFGRLRARMRESFQNGEIVCEANGRRIAQVFSLNFGLVEYVDWTNHQANARRLANPIQYAYLKARRFCREKELRIALSAPAGAQFAAGGELIEFPPSLSWPFDFKAARVDGSLKHLEVISGSDTAYLRSGLADLNIELELPATPSRQAERSRGK